MASQLNVIDNPMFGRTDSVESENHKDDGPFKYAENNGLIGLDDGSPLTNFTREFASERSFFRMKIWNSVLLLLFAIFVSINNTLFDSHWSWYSRILMYHDRHANMLEIFSWTLFFMAALSFVLYWRQKKTAEKSRMSLASLAITDICFSLFILPSFSFLLLCFGLATASECLYLVPRIFGGNSLEDLMEPDYMRGRVWNPNTREYQTTEAPPTTTMSPEQRNKFIVKLVARFILDSSFTIVAFSTILVSILLIFRIHKSIKRTNLWISDYKKNHPNCSNLGMDYGSCWRYGLTKMANWVIPCYLILSMLYGIPSLGRALFITFIFPLTTICLIISFLQWIFYIQEVRFNTGELNAPKDQHLLNRLKADLVLSIVPTAIYFILWYCAWTLSVFHTHLPLGAAVIWCFAGILADLRLLHTYGGKMFPAKLPGISIDLSIKINTKDTEKTIGGNKNQSSSQEKLEIPTG